MNYFELYPGDYLRDTTRLSLTEHGAYLRLLMACYAEERPLPAALDELYVMTSAVSQLDKDSVHKIADRFFPLGEDGLRRNARADAEIMKARHRIETAQRNGAMNRGKKNPLGNPVGNPVGYGLEATNNPETTQRVTQRVTQASKKQDPETTQWVTQPGEALDQEPERDQDQEPRPDQGRELTRMNARVTDLPKSTSAGLACLAMRQAGCIQTNPSHPSLIAALAEGVTPDALADTVREAIASGVSKPFAYAIATARSRRAQGATPIGESHADRPSSRKLSAVEQVEHAIRKRRERADATPDATTLG